MLARLRDFDWSFSNTAETATALLLGAAVIAAILI
jgi:hypothetical protein